MDYSALRENFLDFFKERGHKIVPSSPLLPSDPSVLFTTAGMQQFKPYYLGEKSPYGPNVASVQKCIRTSDIEEVGDECHLTFFEMLGNFSFGGYFKEEAIKLACEFVVDKLGLEIDYVTVFSPDKVPHGDWRKGVAEDKESYEIWKKVGIPESRIKKEGMDNFWGPTGDEGPCGPTTEIYVDGIEIWNVVFNEFFCNKDKKLKKLQAPGVDTGMGLERLAMTVQGKKTVFETDLFQPLVTLIPKEISVEKRRIFADHARAIAFLISDGVKPSNKDQGHVLRRLMRKVLAEEFFSKKYFFETLLAKTVKEYKIFYPSLDSQAIAAEFQEEKNKFSETLEKGISECKKIKHMNAASAFLLYQSFGLPYDVIKEFAPGLRREDFENKLKKHQELSRTASAGMFKGGLADHSPETIRLHTAHHLLLAALQHKFVKSVKQKGSNINAERLRIDFSFSRKLTEKEKSRLEEIVNQKIKEGLSVARKEMPKKEAEKIGAEMEFGVKYGNTVSVYFIQDRKGKIFSKEFCGGPHAGNTAELGEFKIIKEEAVSAGVRRIKAVLK